MQYQMVESCRLVSLIGTFTRLYRMTTPISISGFRDLSFDCQGEHCHFSFTEQATKDLIVRDLGRLI